MNLLLVFLGVVVVGVIGLLIFLYYNFGRPDHTIVGE